MHILRIDFDSGLRMDFGFRAAEHALAARDSLDACKPGGRVMIRDDHGHDASVRIDGIKVAVVVDAAAEAAGAVEVGVAIDNARLETLQFFGRPPALEAPRPRVVEASPEPERARPRFSG